MPAHNKVAIAILLFLSALTPPVALHAKQLRVLFIGNSYTYYNNLPQLVAGMATSGGDQLTYSSSTPGGYSFQQHLADANTIALIQQGNWDFVVLQEQSQLPGFPDAQVAAQVYPYARKLDSMVKKYNSCSRTIFYMTWGRKNGDASNCANFPPLCTYTGMDSLLQARYTIMADSNNAVLSPVGRVWRRLRNSSPALELYDADESHPSANGSYAAACAFYAILFKKNPTTISYNASLSSTDAATIKNAAKLTVFDSLTRYYQYLPVLSGGFNTAINGKTVSFTNTSQQALSYKWYFGDGDSATATHPVHTYATGGVYQVKLVAGRCPDYDTIVKQVTISTTGIRTAPSSSGISLYPNPAGNVLYVQISDEVEAVTITNIQGQRVLHQAVNKRGEVAITVDHLPAGLYYVTLRTQNGNRQASFSKL